MELEEIYQKYPWLQKYTVGTCYDPMISAATGRRLEINPLNYFEAVVTVLVKEHNYDPYVAADEVKKNVVFWAVYIGCDATVINKIEEVYGA